MMLNISVYAQTGGVVISNGAATADGSAMLDVQSDTKGMLVPRMTEAQRDAINPAPTATGLMIYQTDGTAGFYYFDGTAWKSIGAGVHGINDLTDGKTGGFNVFLGEDAGTNNTSGDENTAVGYWAFAANLTGSKNVANGAFALQANSTGLANTAVGYSALDAGNKGDYNTAVGALALRNNLGNNNTALGYTALDVNTAGNNNTALGHGANVTSSNLTNATAIGYNAKVATSSSLVLGGTGTDAVKVGIGTNAPSATLDVAGAVKISDVLKLAPQSDAPTSPEEGDIYVGTDGNIYCYLYGWKQLNN